MKAKYLCTKDYQDEYLSAKLGLVYHGFQHKHATYISSLSKLPFMSTAILYRTQLNKHFKRLK